MTAPRLPRTGPRLWVGLFLAISSCSFGLAYSAYLDIAAHPHALVYSAPIDPVPAASHPSGIIASMSGGTTTGQMVPFTATDAWQVEVRTDCPNERDNMIVQVSDVSGANVGATLFVLAKPHNAFAGAGPTTQDLQAQSGGPGTFTLRASSTCAPWSVTVTQP